MIRMLTIYCCLLMSAVMVPVFSRAAENQTPLPAAAAAAPGKKYPTVIIYTLSTCPHCKDAKEYLTKHNIPYTNREVDSDDAHMEELMKIYDTMGVPDEKRSVPLIIIGDTVHIQGFNKEKIEKALSVSPGR